MSSINLGMTIQQIVEQYPETLPVFTTNGFEQFADQEVVKQLGSFLRLKTALKAKQIDPELFVGLLEERLAEASTWSNNSTELTELPGQLQFLSLSPCPVKVPFEEQFSLFFKSLQRDQSLSLNYCILGHDNNHASYFDYVSHCEHIDELPDIVTVPGFNAFFQQDFIQKFKNKGFFTVVNNYPINKSLSQLDYHDPDGHYTMLAMIPAVIVVDHARLGNLPVPRKWGDLLEPEYEKKVAIHESSTFCDALLLNMYKDFGLEGIEKLGRAMKPGMHPSQMVKLAGSGKAEAPAVSVIPHFFAKMIRKDNTVSVIWPEDGAIVIPLVMLAKTSSRDKVKDILDFLTGASVGEMLADAFCPSTHPEIKNKIPDGAKLKWLGWDYINSNDLAVLISNLNAALLESCERK